MSKKNYSVLHFSTADTLGGSARSAYRIHSGLRNLGHLSRMLVGYKLSNDSDVQSVANNYLLKLADRIANKIGAWLGLQYRFVPSNLFLTHHAWLKDIDIIQLYNTHGGYFSLGLLAHLASKSQLVWRLSDMWPMTGHCAYPASCERWLNGCNECPDLDAYPAISIDRSAQLFRQKQQLYNDINLTIVAPSSWTEKQARRSPILKKFPIVRIPNGLDGRVFQTQNRQQTRAELGLPEQAKVILFSAHMLDNNPRKGSDVLMRALNELGTRKNWILALMGQGGESWIENVPLPVHLLGFQEDANSMARAYAVADVVVIPSVLENLPNTLIEALACGRAVVASDCGGIKDGVIEGKTGFLVPVSDYKALASAICRVLDDDKLKTQFEIAARTLFEKEFSSELEIERFEALYQEILSK